MYELFLRDAPDRRGIHNEDFISIAITSFNRHYMLERLIDSIHKHADMPYEISVSDDGGAMYSDFEFITRLKSKVSHVAVNMGRNKGLHFNTNTAVSLTRSKYVVNFYEDTEVQAPFMRDTVNVLRHAPYVGMIYLDNRVNLEHSMIHCKTPKGQGYNVFCHNGSEWATAFRREYWCEVGGYAEDDIYGDLPFNNRGWKNGYFSCTLDGPNRALDLDKFIDENGHWHSDDTSGKFIDGGYANYPKIFGIPDSKLREMDKERIHQCSLWNHVERTADRENSESTEYINEFHLVGCRNWKRYITKALENGKVDWNLLEQTYHSRYINELKTDFDRVIGER
jgi:glycosyltransferase involved in cell wall biosynthesis